MKRLSVSLTDESRAALERFSEVTGIAASQFVRGLVHDAIPVIDATAQALAVARRSPSKAAQIMTEAALRATAQVSQARLDLEDAAKTPRLRKRPRSRD